jgi:Glutathione-dependent formaldehyde-activating enzyme
MREMTGGCLCGQVRYSANADPGFVGVCHCEHCQKQTGTAFAVLVGIPKSAISIQGQLKTFRDQGDSVNPLNEISVRSADRQSCLTPPFCRVAPLFTLAPLMTRVGLILKCTSIATARSDGPLYPKAVKNSRRWPPAHERYTPPLKPAPGGAQL